MITYDVMLTCSGRQVSSLDDVKSTAQDNNAVKTLALEHLGVIAAHIRTSTLKFKRDSEDSALSPLDEVCGRRVAQQTPAYHYL